MADLFLCHVREDRELAERVAEALESNGYTTWMYLRDAHAFINRFSQVQQSIRDSSAFIFIISREALTKEKEVRPELHCAFNNEKPIAPLLVDLTVDEFRRLRPEWADLILGGVTVVSLHDASFERAMDAIIGGLRDVCVRPTGAPTHSEAQTRRSETEPRSRAQATTTPHGSRRAASEGVARSRRLSVPRWSIALIAVLAVTAIAYLTFMDRSRPPRSEAVEIPEGSFISGMEMDDIPEGIFERYRGIEILAEEGRVERWTDEFVMDRYEVTNEEYARFVKATSRMPPRHWGATEPPPAIARHPVVHVSQSDAAAYAGWVGKRLPTADEWEKAARGSDGRLYPWGNVFDAGRCNAGQAMIGSTCPVDQFAGDVSPFGVVGLGGNVTEWTSSFAEGGFGATAYTICGGSYCEDGELYALASCRRVALDLDGGLEDVGFRCVE